MFKPNVAPRPLRRRPVDALSRPAAEAAASR